MRLSVLCWSMYYFHSLPSVRSSFLENKWEVEQKSEKFKSCPGSPTSHNLKWIINMKCYCLVLLGCSLFHFLKKRSRGQKSWPQGSGGSKGTNLSVKEPSTLSLWNPIWHYSAWSQSMLRLPFICSFLLP